MTIKEFRSKTKEIKKNKFPSTKGIYLQGVPGWKAGNTFVIYINTDDKELSFFDLTAEASLPVSRIKEVASITEKEVEEFQKNRLAGGIAAGALLGPLAGLIVGLDKKTKNKKTFHTFLSIVYEDKNGNENTLVFRTPSETNTALHFNKFVKVLQALIPQSIESNNGAGKVEL